MLELTCRSLDLEKSIRVPTQNRTGMYLAPLPMFVYRHSHFITGRFNICLNLNLNPKGYRMCLQETFNIIPHRNSAVDSELSTSHTKRWAYQRMPLMVHIGRAMR